MRQGRGGRKLLGTTLTHFHCKPVGGQSRSTLCLLSSSCPLITLQLKSQSSALISSKKLEEEVYLQEGNTPFGSFSESNSELFTTLL